MLHSLIAEEGGEFFKNKLGPVDSSYGMGHAPTSKQTVQYPRDSL